MIVWGRDLFFAHWVAVHAVDPDIEKAEDFGRYRAAGIVDGSTILGGVVYNAWKPSAGNMCMSIATVSPRWATRAHILQLLGMPFEILNCKRVTATTRESNPRSWGMLDRLGFKLEGVIRGEDRVLIYGLLRVEYEALAERLRHGR